MMSRMIILALLISPFLAHEAEAQRGNDTHELGTTRVVPRTAATPSATPARRTVRTETVDNDETRRRPGRRAATPGIQRP